MAVPRPILLTLLGTVLLAATFFATRNARDRVADQPTPAPTQQGARPAPEAADKTKPRADKSQAPADKTKPRADKSQAAAKQRRSDRGGAAGKRRRPAASPSVAPAVKRAVAGNTLVVLFFHARGGTDDRQVARSVASLRGRTKAAIFVDRIGNLGQYGQIATSVGVTRSPSIVIIGKGNRGRLIEGYIDPHTLAQRVADAR